MPYHFLERGSCPACGSARTSALYRCGFDEAPIREFVLSYYGVDPDRLAEAPYQLDRCGECTLVFQRWIGDDALLAELYGVWIETDAAPESDYHYREAISAIPESRDAHEIMAAAAHLRLRPDEMATLDYGMGWALWARIAQALGCRSFGTELSPARVSFARDQGVTPIDDHELGEQRFHFINTEQVFEHVPQPGDLARRLAAALVPGGILKISVPAGEGAQRIVDALKAGKPQSHENLMPVQPLEHVNSFTAASLERLAQSAGLRPVRPTLRHRYAFLRHKSAVPLARPKKLAKEMVRPVYQYRTRSNLYRWFEKPRGPHG